ncbi:MAG: GNAT family N-acetyltransferase [Alphaproteobacteria bacterium]|nr:GNAT family N-acetyltransferase [Alphaproteobacteria bacterium]
MIRLVPLGVAELPDFAALHAGFGGCYCAVWTRFGPDWAERCAKGTNLAATEADVRAGRKPGFLVYEGDALVGWTGAGPRAELPSMATRLGSRLGRPDAWAIGCLAFPAEARGRGLADATVEAVVAEARAAGAAFIEAFPTRPWDEPRSYRGSERLYARHGFTVVASDPDGGSEILLMRRYCG